VSLVLDSSATLAWIYGDETTESIRELFDAIADSGAVVPALWRLEVANSLTVAVRRGRIDAEFRQAALADLALLDITIDPHTDAHAWAATLQLADSFRLTLHDAAYAELAQRRTLPLARLDKDLSAATAALGLACLEAPHDSAAPRGHLHPPSTILAALAELPQEEIRLAKQKSAPARRAYRLVVQHFMRTLGITARRELRQVDHRAVIARERHMREVERAAPSRLSASVYYRARS
jgi:predicted nucleic acid-binding protein